MSTNRLTYRVCEDFFSTASSGVNTYLHAKLTPSPTRRVVIYLAVFSLLMSQDDDPTDKEAEQSVREAIEHSRIGAPAAGEAVRDRFSADEIYQRVVVSAVVEVTAGFRERFFSGLAAGFAIALTFTLHAAFTAQYGSEGGLAGEILYPLGFIYIIIGNYQLYTENTLPPVTLVLERLVSVPRLLRIWIVVFMANAVGAGIGAFVLANTGVLPTGAVEAAATFGTEGLETPWWDLFYKSVFAGFIVAGVVWLDFAARDTISRVVLVYLAFLSIPTAGLYHSVVTSADMMFLVFEGQVGFITGIIEFLTPVLLGNTVGGVVLVTLVNYAQTSDERMEFSHVESIPRLSPREWLFGGLAGRSHVQQESETESP